MHIIKSLFSAFSMYSRIPVPQVEWKEENRRYSLCFFWLIGAVIGLLMIVWHCICGWLNIGKCLFSAVCVIIPIAVTGGIHLDGFCDVSDAKASCAAREKALLIMSDSHIGAFAAINLGIYFLLSFALFTEVESLSAMAVIACGFIQSRVLSGLAAVSFKNAKSEGTLQNFSKPAHKKVTIIVLLIVLAAIAAAMMICNFTVGIFGFVGGLAAFLYYRIFSYKRFGGITGDLAGYFLQLCEIAVLGFSVLGQRLIEVLI